MVKETTDNPASSQEKEKLATFQRMFGDHLLSIGEKSTDFMVFPLKENGQEGYLLIFNRGTARLLGVPLCFQGSDVNTIYLELCSYLWPIIPEMEAYLNQRHHCDKLRKMLKRHLRSLEEDIEEKGLFSKKFIFKSLGEKVLVGFYNVLPAMELGMPWQRKIFASSAEAYEAIFGLIRPLVVSR